VATVTTTAEIADQVTRDGLWNLSSHQSDPIGAAAVAATIDIVRQEGLVDRARETGDYFMARLRDLSSRQPAVANVRGQGLMIGFDLQAQDADAAVAAANRFMYACRRRGLHLTYGYGSVNFRIIPPLILTREEIDFAIDVMEKSLQEAFSGASGKDDLPLNPYTRPMFERSPVRNLLRHWWQSSPEEWVEKGGRKIRKQFGGG